MEDVKQLVTRAQAGDTDAYGTLVRRFQDMAYGYAYSIVGDWGLAEDAAQEAFIEAYRCLPNLREPLAFPGWFKRIVFKQCDRLTRSRRQETTSLDRAQELPARTPSPADQAERRELQETVLRAIRELPARQHEKSLRVRWNLKALSSLARLGNLGYVHASSLQGGPRPPVHPRARAPGPRESLPLGTIGNLTWSAAPSPRPRGLQPPPSP